jgi:hypothetical protein
VRSLSIPPRGFSICVYTTEDVGRSTSFEHRRWRKVQASGPETSSFAKELSSNKAARRRHARCSVTIAVDQCSPAQPRGRRPSCAGSSFERNQFTRSQPDFSPNSASSA